MSHFDVGGCSKPIWWSEVTSLGLFSESEAEQALESLENAGKEVTPDAVVNYIYENGAGSPSGEHAADSGDEDDDLGDVAAAQGNARLKQLEELGYDSCVASVALSYHASYDPIEKVVDWLDAFLLSDADKPGARDAPNKPRVEGVDLVVEELKLMLDLSPHFEEAIRKHGCKDVAEALDLQKALDLQDAWEENDYPNRADGSGRGKRALEEDSFWERDMADEDFDGYDTGLTDAGWEEVRVIRKQKKTKQRGARSAVVTVQRDEFFSWAENGRTGYGVPGTPVIPRHLTDDLAAPPYFYFENVASMPKDEWNKISNELYGIAPEFVDALHFSACRRARGYIHNLPVEGRQLLIPEPPMTIQELFPQTRKYWPAWDPRRKLNCIDSRCAPNTVVKPICESLKENAARLPVDEALRKGVLLELKKWNLVWTGPNLVSNLNAEEMEVVLGYDANHTRGVVNKTDQWKCLGSCFQVNTVAYHLSVLKPMFPDGINVISLFAGIGGAEVALHKNGIKINVLVSVEVDDKVRAVVSNWWEVSEQKGQLVHDIHDVRDLTRGKIVDLLRRYGKFDLLIGGSPCNNLSGNNRVSRTGLAGEHSSLFYEYKRILNTLRLLTGPR